LPIIEQVSTLAPDAIPALLHLLLSVRRIARLAAEDIHDGREALTGNSMARIFALGPLVMPGQP